MLDFIKPAASPLLITLFQRLFTLIALQQRGPTRLVLSPEVKVVFNQLKKQRTIICANHPGEEDGPVLFGLSAMMHEKFFFLAAREIFGNSSSRSARMLQRLGCYSVQRGLADIHAFKESCSLLEAGRHKLVIFPEGEVSFKNDSLREFESGPELIALSTQNVLSKAGSRERVFILPLAIKYVFSRDIERYLLKTLKLFEAQLGIISDNKTEFHKRLRRVFDDTLKQIESSYGLSNSQDSIDKRISAICDARISQWEVRLGLVPSKNLSQVRQIHLVINGIAKLLYGQDNSALPVDHLALEAAYRQLKQSISLMAVTEHRFTERMSQEDAIELLRALAQLLRPEMKIKRADLVYIGAADPIDVSKFMPTVSAERKSKVKELKYELEERISRRLSRLNHVGSSSRIASGSGALCKHPVL